MSCGSKKKKQKTKTKKKGPLRNIDVKIVRR
jgi:hypothetical protein